MSLISESKIKEYRNTNRFITITESLKQFRNESKYNKRTIFLSHKHDELDILDGAISFLKKEGTDVYIDWLDEGMPKTTSEYTAQRIKEKIKENDKFILLASEGAINSKWCNWELGLGDAAKYINNIALLPIEKDNTTFSGAEYLQIYPYIQYENGNRKYLDGRYIPAGYYVLFPVVNGNHHIESLQTWLSKK